MGGPCLLGRRRDPRRARRAACPAPPGRRCLPAAHGAPRRRRRRRLPRPRTPACASHHDRVTGHGLAAVRHPVSRPCPHRRQTAAARTERRPRPHLGPTTAARGTATPPGAPAPGPVAGATRTYVVRRGDTLWGIAERELGDPLDWSRDLRPQRGPAPTGRGHPHRPALDRPRLDPAPAHTGRDCAGDSDVVTAVFVPGAPVGTGGSRSGRYAGHKPADYRYRPTNHHRSTGDTSDHGAAGPHGAGPHGAGSDGAGSDPSPGSSRAGERHCPASGGSQLGPGPPPLGLGGRRLVRRRCPLGRRARAVASPPRLPLPPARTRTRLRLATAAPGVAPPRQGGSRPR